MTIRYVIRTLDRPRDLADLLAFMAAFAPDLGLVVIDGSEEAVQAVNRDEIARHAGRLSIELVPIAPDMPIVERTVAGLRAIDDPFVFFGADDDFPCIEFVRQAEALIAAGRVAPTDKIFGDQVKLTLLSLDHILVKNFSVPDSGDPDPMVRLRRLSLHYQPLVYGIFGREALIEEYLATADVLVTGPHSYDFALGERFMGAIAVARGVLHYVPGLSLIRSVKSERHESIKELRYPTLFLPNAYERAWSAVHHLARAMGGSFDAMEYPAKQALVREVHDLAVGRRGRADMSKNPNWQIGDTILRNCFTAGTPEHRQYRERLVFARDRLVEGVLELEARVRDAQPERSLFPQPEELAEKLRNAARINASDWGLMLDLHSMTILDGGAPDDEALRRERRRARRLRG
jgi:hypothetical protein